MWRADNCWTENIDRCDTRERVVLHTKSLAAVGSGKQGMMKDECEEVQKGKELKKSQWWREAVKTKAAKGMLGQAGGGGGWRRERKSRVDKRKRSFILNPQSVDWSVSSQIRGLCQPSGGSRCRGCKAQLSKAHRSCRWGHAGNKMLQAGLGDGCESS